MRSKKITRLSQVKTLEDLQKLKLQEKYTLELRKLEFQTSWMRLMKVINPENLKNSILFETKNYIQDLVLKNVPGFISKIFFK